MAVEIVVGEGQMNLAVHRMWLVSGLTQGMAREVVNKILDDLGISVVGYSDTTTTDTGFTENAKG